MGNAFTIRIPNNEEIAKDLIGELTMANHNPNHILWRLIPNEIVENKNILRIYHLRSDNAPTVDIVFWIIFKKEHHHYSIFQQIEKNVRCIETRYRKRCELAGNLGRGGDGKHLWNTL